MEIINRRAVDERVKVFDEPLSVLCSLVVASQREVLPGWARSLVDSVLSGDLESRLRLAIEALPG